MATIGKNILENLTTGMYTDSKVIYREYIQNACDQIDKAIEQGITVAEEAKVEIFIDKNKRSVEILDNATGVKSIDFRTQLGDIANSDKKVGREKGFRGIGRLCGLAYCKTLRFTTSYLGEAIKSEMVIDASKMRAMLVDDKKYTIDEVLDAITFWKESEDEPDKHYFRVELLEINFENTELLDKKLVKDYLSFVAPVEYKNTFTFRELIKSHANSIGYHIDEYHIFLNGGEIYKEYKTRLYDGKDGTKRAYDDIFNVEFEDLYDSNNRLIAWMWYGLSRFEKSIPKATNPMYGLRVRQGNIQIGTNEVLAPLFKEQRGNGYFIGEVFVVAPQLIPNSQRDYFNENQARVEFEDLIQAVCYDKLHRLYYAANVTKNEFKRLAEFEKAVTQYVEAEKKGFVDERERITLENAIEEASKRKDAAEKNIARITFSDENDTQLDTIQQVQKAIKNKYEHSGLPQKVKRAEKARQQKEKSKSEKNEKVKTKYFTDELTKLDGTKRKLVRRIMKIVCDNVTPEEAQKIQAEIVKEFK